MGKPFKANIGNIFALTYFTITIRTTQFICDRVTKYVKYLAEMQQSCSY